DTSLSEKRRPLIGPCANGMSIATRSTGTRARHQARAFAYPAEPAQGGQHRRDDAGGKLAAAQRARLFGRYGEKGARVVAPIIEPRGGGPPLPHREGSRPLTWPSRRSISRRRWRGFPPRRSSNCAASGGGCIERRRPCGSPVIS